MQILPVWETLARRFDARASIVSVIATKREPVQDLVARAKQLGANNPTYFDVDGSTHDRWGVTGHPTILIVDRAGVVVREIDTIAMRQAAGPEGTADDLLHRLEFEVAAVLEELLR